MLSYCFIGFAELNDSMQARVDFIAFNFYLIYLIFIINPHFKILIHSITLQVTYLQIIPHFITTIFNTNPFLSYSQNNLPRHLHSGKDGLRCSNFWNIERRCVRILCLYRDWVVIKCVYIWWACSWGMIC
jgi:hypothetical protein